MSLLSESSQTTPPPPPPQHLPLFLLVLGASGPRSETALGSGPPRACSGAPPAGAPLLNVHLQGSVLKLELAALTYSLLARCPENARFQVCSVTRHSGTHHLPFCSLRTQLPIVQGTETQREGGEHRFPPKIFCSPHCTSACFAPLGTGYLGDQLARKGLGHTVSTPPKGTG